MTDLTNFYTTITSPLGDLLIARRDEGLTHINFQEGSSPMIPDPAWRHDPAAFQEAAAQLAAYFAGELRQFDLPLAPQGTPFQMIVWTALTVIPYGQTIAYSDLAERIGRPTATRAVGAANGRNPLPVILPCHRVIGRNGELTGYGGGLPIKKALLALERTGRLAFEEQLTLL